MCFLGLAMDRIIFLGTAINDSVEILFKLNYYSKVLIKKNIQITSIHLVDLFMLGGIYDTMQFIGPNVATICTGIAASMSAVLLCAGEGKDLGLTHSRVMIHQPLGGAQAKHQILKSLQERLVN